MINEKVTQNDYEKIYKTQLRFEWPLVDFGKTEKR